MKIIDAKIRTVETLNVSVKLNEDIILNALRDEARFASHSMLESVLGHNSCDGWEIKSVSFQVPGGGDWSGMDIDLNNMKFDIVLEKKT